jgi:hypothetical protein
MGKGPVNQEEDTPLSRLFDNVTLGDHGMEGSDGRPFIDESERIGA